MPHACTYWIPLKAARETSSPPVDKMDRNSLEFWTLRIKDNENQMIDLQKLLAHISCVDPPQTLKSVRAQPIFIEAVSKTNLMSSWIE